MNHAYVRVGMPAIWHCKLPNGSIKQYPCKIIGVSSQRVRILVKRWGNVPVKVSVKAQYLEVKEREVMR
jgi:hypothetical protein